jgi:hypothetical protein
MGSTRYYIDLLTRLQNVAEKPGAVFRKYTIIWIGRVVKSPEGRIAPLALEHKLTVEWEKVVSGKHLLLLSALPGI